MENEAMTKRQTMEVMLRAEFLIGSRSRFTEEQLEKACEALGLDIEEEKVDA